MSLSYTYAEMATQLQNWPLTNDPDFIGNLPNIISEGEDALIRALGLQIFEVTLTADITANSGQLIKPDGFISLEEMWIDDEVGLSQLTRQHPDWVRAYAGPSATPNLGRPKFFCETDVDTWNIAPVPIASGTMNLQCVARPVELSPDTPDGYSWLSTNYADVLFLQCLMVAERYLKNDDRWAVAKREYDIQLVTAKTETETLRRVLPDDQTTNRDIQRASNAEGQPNQL